MRIPSLGARALPVARQRVPPRRRPVKRGPELQTGPPRKERLFAPETETTKGARFQTKARPRWTGPREFRGRRRDTPRSSRRRHHGAQLSPRLRSHREEETMVPSRAKIHVIACRRISSRGVRVTVLRFRGVPGHFSRRIHLAYSAVGPGSVSVYFLVCLTSSLASHVTTSLAGETRGRRLRRGRRTRQPLGTRRRTSSSGLFALRHSETKLRPTFPLSRRVPSFTVSACGRLEY